MHMSSYRSPKTEFHNSLIDGKGRFAKEPISKGEIVAIRSGHIITGAQLKQYQEVINDAEHQIEDDFFLAPLSHEEFEHVMCYINHSCEPNVGMEGSTIMVAMRDIAAGEELCLDYAMIFSHDKSFECKCGKTTCRQKITGKDWQKPDLQLKYQNYFVSYLTKKIHLTPV